MEWVLLSLWAMAAAAIGYPIARLSLPGETRLVVLIPFGVLAGHSLQALALMLLWGYFALGTSFVLVMSASAAGALVLWIFTSSRQATTWGCSWRDGAILAAMSLIYGVYSYRSFLGGAFGGDAEALYWHSGLVTWLGRSTFPPASPLEPDGPLNYRYGLHAFAAAIGAHSPSDGSYVMAATMAFLMPLTVLALTGLSVRLFNSPRPGFVSSLLALLGGSLLPYFRALQSAVTGATPMHAREYISGQLLTGNTADLLRGNVSLAIGISLFSAALWLGTETLEHRGRGPAAFLAAVAALAYLGLSNEVYFAALAAGLLAAAGMKSIREWRGRISTWWRATVLGLVLVASAYILVLARGGLLGGISFSTTTTHSLRLVLNTEHLGAVPLPPGLSVDSWVPLFSPKALIDTDFMVLTLPALLFAATRQTRIVLLVLPLASICGLVAWTAIYPKAFPPDAYRFGQEAVTVYLMTLPLVVSSSGWRRPRLGSRLTTYLCMFGIGALILPHAAMAAWAVPASVSSAIAVPGTPDYSAAEYLRAIPGPQRVLVPLDHPGDGWSSLYRRGEPVHDAMRTVLGVSGQAVPLGHAPYFDPVRYQVPYEKASLYFDRDALRSLEIGWLLVLPAFLDPGQTRHLQTAIQKGYVSLVQTYGVAGREDERWLLRVVQK